MKRNVAIVHYNTPELTEAAILSLRKHGGENYSVYVFDNSDERPFTRKMKGVTVFDNTKGRYIDFDEELAKYPERNPRARDDNNYGSDKHMMTVQRLWELLPDGFVLMDSDVLIKSSIETMFREDECAVGYVSYVTYMGVPRLMPMLLWINVPLCKAGGARFFDPDRCWGLHAEGDSRNYWDTGAAFLDDIKRMKPLCHGKAITKEAILRMIVHYGGGSWRQSDVEKQKEWLNEHRDLWQPSPRERGIKDVAICAIGRLENAYAVEFVEHYLNMGVTRIFLYDNGFGNEPKLGEVVSKYERVTVIDWRDRRNAQCAAYEDCYAKHGDAYAWIGFFDFDELLNIGTKKSLPRLMEKYGADVDAVLVNWRIMTDEGKTMEPSRCVKYDFPENDHIKTFLRGGLQGVEWKKTPHVPSSPVLRCVKAHGEPTEQKTFADYDPRPMCLDHYTTRTAEEFVQKVRRGFPCGDRYTNGYRAKAVEYFFAINERTEEKERILAKL